jgi:hypothetical protein
LPSTAMKFSITTAAGLAVLAIAYMIAASGDTAIGAGTAPAAPATSAQTMQRAASTFGVFRRAQAASDDVATAFAGQRDSVVRSTIRSVRPDAETQADVAVDDAQVCVETDLGAWSDGEHVSVCAPAASVEANGLVGTSHPSPRVAERLHLDASAMQVIALVPDGVASVSFRDADGDSRNAAVHDNVAVGHLAGSASTAQFTLDSVTHSLPLGGAR